MDKTLVLSELEKTKRTDEIQKLLNVFIEKWNNHELAVRITIKESAALKITERYFQILTENIKGVYLSPEMLINKYKVSSCTELSVMIELPIDSENHEDFSPFQRRKVNARFAVEAAMQMLYSIHYNDIDNLKIDGTKKSSISTLLFNHQNWLSYLNLDNSIPTLLNANFWEAVFISTVL